MRRFVFCLFLVVSSISFGGDWPQWRGAFWNGSSDETGLVDSFDEAVWSVDLPGPSGATPVICGGQVFLTSMDTQGAGVFCAMSLDARTGGVLWQKKIGTDTRKFPRNNMATPSPATDGERVFFLFGNGQLIATDFKGKTIWERDLEAEYGNLSVKYGYSSSPLIYDGKLYVVMIRRPLAYRRPETDKLLDSWILALDSGTGENVWKVERKTDAEDENCDSYASAVIFDRGDRQELITVGGDYVMGHDPKTGKELWRYWYNPDKKEKLRHIPSAVTGDGLVFAVGARRGAVMAIRSGSGSLGTESIVWRNEECTTDSPTPAYYKGSLYVLNDRGKSLSCLDAKSGKVKWAGKLPGRTPYYASPTVADGKIYCLSEGGDAVVVAAGGGEFKIISEREFDEGPMQSSIAISGGRVFVRTAKKLYCFGK